MREGAITCDSLGRPGHDYVWLVSDGEYGDFELRLLVRGFRRSPGNSGIQFRSRYDRAAGWLDGPQVDVHPPAPWRTGLVYDETREAKRWIFPSLPDWRIEPGQGPREWRWRQSDEGDGWNEVHITHEGRGSRPWSTGSRSPTSTARACWTTKAIAGTTSGGGATSPSSSTGTTSS